MSRSSNNGVARPESSMGVAGSGVARTPRPSKTLGVPHFEHTAIRASAGAGKTYQLTNRFIALLAADELPDRVLATTFTRKAAGEILERILQRLAAAALDSEACAKLGTAIDRPNLSPKRACELVGRLARSLHRLHARTLDSFFARIARSFALELDLPPEWQIIDDPADAVLRGEAIQAVLREEDPRLLTELVRLLAGGDASRSVAERIGRLVQDLHALYGETNRDAWERVPRPQRHTAKLLGDAIAALEQVAVPLTKQGNENTNWRKAVTAACEAARAEDWEKFLKGGMVKAAVQGGEFYCEPVSPPIRDALRPLIEQARAVLLNRLADRCDGSYRLLEKFDERYRRLQRSERGLRFEDVTRALAQSAAVQDYHDIYFRLDAEVGHLLLDEFQDTSLLQWEVVRPIAEEVTSHTDQSHSFFCVGDVKQAIYGWRGGVAEIFDTLGNDLPELAWEPLNESRRSSPVIIDTVNRVFRGLAENAGLAGYSDAAAAWRQRFEEHKTARTELPGYASLRVAPRADAGTKQFERTLVDAADEITRIHRQAPGRSIGVLVRKNKGIARLIYELRERGVQASEEGGNPLTDTPAVTVLLSLLELADHPSDSVARFHVASSPLGPLVSLTRHDDASAARRVAAFVRRSLMQHGYGATLWHWVRQLAEAGACDDRDLNRLGQLVELAHRYEPKASLRPSDFVEFVVATPVEDPVPAGVRVMTIHKAKGLQFDVVVLPDLDGKLIAQRPAVVTGRPSTTARVNTVCLFVNETIRDLLPPDLQRLFVESENQSVCGELCVLYVALTRAIHALHLIAAPSGEKAEKGGGLPATFAGILRGALTDGHRLEPTSVPYEHGEADWHSRHERPGVAAADTAPKRERGEVPELAATGSPSLARRASVEAAAPAESLAVAGRLVSASPAHAVRGLARESPSGLEGGQQVDLRKRLRLGNAAALEFGSIAHAWFELIEWLDDGEPDDAALRDAARRSGARCESLDEKIVTFRAMLRQPAIRAALSRPKTSGAASLEVWRERPFVIRWDEALLTGKFDRVVVTRDGARVVRAEVLDFKTDAVPADDPARLDVLVDHYRPQLKAYRDAASRLTGIDASQVSSRLLFVTVGTVRDV